VISLKDIAPQIFFDSSQAVYNCYLLPNGVTEQSRRHSSGTTSPLFFYIHKTTIQINELTLHASLI